MSSLAVDGYPQGGGIAGAVTSAGSINITADSGSSGVGSINFIIGSTTVGQITNAGSLLMGSGTNQTSSGIVTTGKLIDARLGTNATPDAGSSPALKVSRTTAIVGGLFGDGAQQAAALAGIVWGTATQTVQATGISGIARNAGTSGNPDAAGGEFWGRIEGGGTGAGIGIVASGYATASAGGGAQANSAQFFVFNQTGADAYLPASHGQLGGGQSTMRGLSQYNAAQGVAAAGVEVNGPNNATNGSAQFDVGYRVMGNIITAAITTATGVNAINSATINCGSTAGFPASGVAFLASVPFTYTGTTATSFTGCGNHAATVGGEAMTSPSMQSTTATGIQVINSATLNVASTLGFPASGTAYLTGVAFTYTGKTATSFTGCGNHAGTSGGDLVNYPQVGAVQTAAFLDESQAQYGLWITQAHGTAAILVAANAGSISFGAGCKFGVFGATPVAQPGPYTVTNPTTNRSLNVTGATLNQLAQVVGTLIADIQSLGVVG